MAGAGTKTYGLPLYCAAWVRLDRMSAAAVEAAEETNEEGEVSASAAGTEEEEEETKEERLLVALGGGGGEGRSGVPNALVIAEVDLTTRSLSDQPVFRMGTESNVAYRMTVHPGGDGIVCSFPHGCRWFEWEFQSHKLALISSERTLTQLEDAKEQLALAFNAEGSMLASGGEDGHLRVFKWPNMDIILDQTDARTSIKDLDFSSDGRFLVSLGDRAPCRVWDLQSSTVLASLPNEIGEVFRFCRFSQSTDSNQILFVVAMQGDQGKIVSWNTESWKRVGSKKIVRQPVSAFNVSADGKLLAVGTLEGSIMILKSDMQMLKEIKKAHLGLVTAMAFSQDSRALLSASFDSSARVTLVEGRKNSGLNMGLIVLVIMLAILVFFLKLKEAI